MSILKRWREIVLLGIVFIAVLFLAMLIKNLLSQRAEAINTKNIFETAYNNIQSGETSEAKLEIKVNEMSSRYGMFVKYLPKELKKTDVILALTKMSKEAKMEGFEIGNCTITNDTSKEQKKYEQIKVQVKKISGTYEDIKGFLEYVKNYENKITISSMSFIKVKDTDKFEGNMTLVFYGDIEA